MIKIWTVSFKILELFDEGFANAFGVIRNWGRWSDKVAVILPDITLCDVILQKILSVRVLEWPVRESVGVCKVEESRMQVSQGNHL